jgi:hypothetical protein
MSEDSIQSFKDAFGKFLKEEHLELTYKQKDLAESWERIMGRPISGRTSKITFQGKTMLVHLTSAPLKQELTNNRTLVMERIVEHVGEGVVDEVRFL